MGGGEEWGGTDCRFWMRMKESTIVGEWGTRLWWFAEWCVWVFGHTLAERYSEERTLCWRVR